MTEKDKIPNKVYSESDIRWAKLQSFVAGFVAACVAIAGITNFFLSVRGLIK